MEEVPRRGGEGEELVHAYILFLGTCLWNDSLFGKRIQVSLVRCNSVFKFIHPIHGELDSFCSMRTLPELVDEGLLVLPDTATLLARKSILKGHRFPSVDIHFWIKIGIERHSVELVSTRILSGTDFRVFLDIQPLGTMCNYRGNHFGSEWMLAQWKTSRQFLLEAASSASGLGLTPPEHVIKSSNLSDHQKQGLKWMFDREEYNPDADEDPLFPFWEEKNGVYRDLICDFITLKRPYRITGGILADETGMGKTLTLLSLIAYTTRKTAATVSHTRKKRRKLLPEHNPTLVVCPPSAVATWKQQIKQWTTRPGALKYCTYSSSSSAHDTTNWLMQHDLVLATYDDVNIPDSVLYQVEWWRVILDDAHVCLNLPSYRTVRPPFTELKARRRWAVTGKPVHFENYPLDSIMYFFGLPLFSQVAFQPQQSKVLMEIFSLRRVMPVKSIQNHMVVLSKYERDIYESLEAKARDSASQLTIKALQASVLHLWLSCNSLEELSTRTEMLSESMKIQEISREPELLRTVAKALQEDRDYDCPICLDQPEAVIIVTRCAHMFCVICIDRMFNRRNGKSSCPMCRALLTKEDIFSAERGAPAGESSYANMSSKFSSLLILLVKSRSEDPSKKSVVISQFKRMLMPVARALLEAGFNVKLMDAIDNAEEKVAAVEEFRNADPPVILLATLKAFSDGIPGGLDMSADCCNVYLMEPCLDIEREREVLCSIHGYWTKGYAKVVRLVCKDSIEERVLQIREEQNAIRMDMDLCMSSEDPTREILLRSRRLNLGLLGLAEETEP